MVIQGADRATNRPMDAATPSTRDVYHHVAHPADMNRSLFAALKPRGRLAVIDFEPKPGSPIPDGVAADRGGHGITAPIVIAEVTASGFTHVRTIPVWPPVGKGELFLVLFERP